MLKEKAKLKIKGYFNYFRKKIFLILNKNKLPILGFIGIDGSGKTTSINQLKTSLDKIDIKTLRFETKQKFSLLSKLLLKFNESCVDRVILFLYKFNLNKAYQNLNYIRNLIFAILIIYDTKQKYNLFKNYAINGYLLLVDRWWIDFILPEKNQIYLVNPFIKKLFLKLPLPDLFIYMDTSLDICIKRRKEDNPKVLELKKKKLKSLIFSNNSYKILTLDGSLDIKKNIKKIHDKLYKCWILNKS